ncbi:MAG: tetratricopeptide repeat protein [Bacteroidales bacterium]
MKRILYLAIAAVLFASCGSEEKKDASDGVSSEVEKVMKEKSGQERQSPSVPKLEQQPAPKRKMDNAQVSNSEVKNYFNAGIQKYQAGNYAAGIKEFEKVVRVDPGNARAYYNLGLGRHHTDDFSGAVDAFTHVLEINPEDTLALLYRGLTYYLLQDFKRSIQDYNKALEIDPEYAKVYYNRGTVRGQMKDYTGAIKDFSKAIELKPGFTGAYFHLGHAYYFRGNVHEACYYWKKAGEMGFTDAERLIQEYCLDE